jgi:CRISPR-associated protein (TIGR02710 family)
MESPSAGCKAMLVSVGGSPNQVVYTLSQNRPEYILFFVSPETQATLLGIIRKLPDDYQCRAFDIIRTDSGDSLSDCLRALREALPGKLSQWGLKMEDLLVDYTGGTKSMAAALVLATIERVPRYSYVGGLERDRGGTGVVVDGRECMLYYENPWQVLALEERKRVGVLFDAARYEAARQELERIAGLVEQEERQYWQELARLVEGYRDWDDFRHADAQRKIGVALKFLGPIAVARRDSVLSGLLEQVREHLQFLGRVISREGRDEAYIWDLIGNAGRRAELEHKYEDAVARLYSCLERAARFRLQRRYGIATEDVRPEALPQALREEFERRYSDPGDGKIRLPLKASYRLLRELRDELGARFMEREEEIGDLLLMRNGSPLGHGEAPVGEEGYRRFRDAVLELLGSGSEQIPRFPRWPW